VLALALGRLVLLIGSVEQVYQGLQVFIASAFRLSQALTGRPTGSPGVQNAVLVPDARSSHFRLAKQTERLTRVQSLDTSIFFICIPVSGCY